MKKPTVRETALVAVVPALALTVALAASSSARRADAATSHATAAQVRHAVRRAASGYQETVLYAFQGGDGKYPAAPILVGARGVLYSTTYLGGPPAVRAVPSFSWPHRKAAATATACCTV